MKYPIGIQSFDKIIEGGELFLGKERKRIKFSFFVTTVTTTPPNYQKY